MEILVAIEPASRRQLAQKLGIQVFGRAADKGGTMRRFVLLTVVAFGVAGCGGFKRVEASITGYSFVCVEQVQYIQFASGVTVAYNTDGTVKTCN